MVGSQVLPIAVQLRSLLSDFPLVARTVLAIGTEVSPIVPELLTGVPPVLLILLALPCTGPMPLIHWPLLTVMTNGGFILPESPPIMLHPQPIVSPFPLVLTELILRESG